MFYFASNGKGDTRFKKEAKIIISMSFQMGQSCLRCAYLYPSICTWVLKSMAATGSTVFLHCSGVWFFEAGSPTKSSAHWFSKTCWQKSPRILLYPHIHTWWSSMNDKYPICIWTFSYKLIVLLVEVRGTLGGVPCWSKSLGVGNEGL